MYISHISPKYPVPPHENPNQQKLSVVWFDITSVHPHSQQEADCMVPSTCFENLEKESVGKMTIVRSCFFDSGPKLICRRVIPCSWVMLQDMKQR